ncbi:MAG: tetratricopeptide repeat protein [Pseudomonadota bacterium]
MTMIRRVWLTFLPTMILAGMLGITALGTPALATDEVLVELPAAVLDAAPGAPLELTPVEAFRSGAEAYHAGDKQAAVKALEFAAQNGHAVAQWKLGRMYADGDGVDTDQRKAFSFFQALASEHAEDNPNARHASAVSNAFVALGTYYMNGIPDMIQPDVGQAVRLFRHAATYFGDSDAQYRLARLYLEDSGVARHPKTAARWLNLAAKKGHVEAQALLGQMLWYGDEGVRPRRAQGLAFLLLAHERANTAERNWITPLLNEALDDADNYERERALERAAKWRERHLNG